MRYYIWPMIFYHLLCFQFISTTLSSSSSTHLCSQIESDALFHFKSHFSINKTASNDCVDDIGLTIKPYPKTDSWKEDIDCCSWDGVSCDNITGHIISLDLRCSYLSGSFPSNTTFFHLSHLQRLDLSFNDFRNSRIPSKFGLFQSLTHLDLSSSWFSGPVPYEISYLSNLDSLHLSYRPQKDLLIDMQLQAPGGPILKLEESALNGIVRNMTKVRDISLDGIDMSSIDPNSLMNLSHSLTSLSLVSCHLRGKFPEYIFNLPNIKYLMLDYNLNLTGQFPKSNWSSPLEVLGASGTSMSGELPESLGNLKSLQGLGLVSCKFSGSIPRSVGNLSQLSFLFLSYNNLSGEIPSSITNLTKLAILSLDNNQLEGSLPDNNPNAFPGLLYLDLSDNLLTGPTPSWLYTIPSLTFLYLSYNQFIGHISEFQNRLLSFIRLSHNGFRGPIPSSISKLVNLTFLDLSSNKLNGTISLDMFSQLQNLQFLYLSDNTLSLSSTNNVNYVLPNLEYVDFGSNIFNEFPRFLEGSKMLKYLNISNNRIRGKLPSKFPWEHIEYIDFHSNFIEGDLPILPPNIEYIDFHSNFIEGGLPISMSELVNLSTLDLSSNFIEELVNLRTLDLSLNFIAGDLPISISELVNLRTLDLSSNFIGGDLPILPPNISFLSVSNNSFTGNFPQICNAKFLEILDLSHNHFSGVIPQCIGNFSQSLSSLNLKMNKLQGTIPSTFATGCALKNLNLNSNHLEGPVTRSITNCKDLEVVDIGNNKINDTFPHWMQALPELQVLVLRSNEFHGPITAPKSRQSLRKLRIVDLSYNNFFGPLPTSYMRNFEGMMNILDGGKAATYMGERKYSYDYSVGIAVKGFEIELVKILTIFTSIDLSSNNFQGEIPRVVGELRSLRGLNLSHNNLVGHIPPPLGNLSNLEWLDLSSNKLSGQIPTELLDLTFLSSFNVSYNQLVGLIPQGKQFSTFENGSYRGNEGLCGVPLLRGCNNNESPPAPWKNAQEDDGSKFEFGWKAVAIGYGFGFVFGAGMGYRCLQTGKPVWLVTLFKARRRRR